MTQTRLKELLKNAIHLLECMNTASNALIKTDLKGKLNITQREYDKIKSTDKLDTVIYVVSFEWATEDASDLEIFTYAEFKDALNKYNEIITDEMNPELSWVGSDAFDKQGRIKENYYSLSSNDYNNKEEDLHWHVSTYNSVQHSYVNLYIKKV